MGVSFPRVLTALSAALILASTAAAAPASAAHPYNGIPFRQDELLEHPAPGHHADRSPVRGQLVSELVRQVGKYGTWVQHQPLHDAGLPAAGQDGDGARQARQPQRAPPEPVQRGAASRRTPSRAAAPTAR